MSSMQNSFRIHKSKSISDMASEILQDTHVESAYDRRGKFSHLSARLPRGDFIRLYSSQSTASIFIQGYWFLLCLEGSKKYILNRTTHTALTLDVAVNEYGVTELSFFRQQKRVARFKLNQIMASDLLNTENGFHCIARAAVKAFLKLRNGMNTHAHPFQTRLPVVLVMMKQTRPESSLGFDPAQVLLQ